MTQPQRSAKSEPPQDLAAEKNLLGSILAWPDKLDDVAAILTREDFYLLAHGNVYAAALDLHSRNKPVDAIAIADYLTSHGQHEGEKTTALLEECLLSVPHAAHAAAYAEIIAEKAQRRNLSQTGQVAIEAAYDRTRPVDESVAQVGQSLEKILERKAGGQAADLQTILSQALERIGSGAGSGILSGFSDLDHITKGFQPGNLVVVAARPSIGKSAFGINVCQNLCEAGFSVGIISLEMTTLEVAERMLSASARIPMDQMRGTGLTEAQRDSIMKAASELSAYKLHIDGCEYRGIAGIEASARLMVRRKEIQLLVIDYLQMISGQKRRDNREQEVAEVSGRLKWISKSLGIPVVALAQINRESEKRPDKRPRLSDLRESGSIEQDADLVLMLHRPDVYDADDSPGQAIVTVAKNRNGPTGEVRLQFEKTLMQFRNLAPGCIYAPEPVVFRGGYDVDPNEWGEAA